jgi:hypothetical protein
METNKFFYWFRVAVKALIPLSFFIIAIAEGKAFWIAGVMTIVTLFYYLILFNGIGAKK